MWPSNNVLVRLAINSIPSTYSAILEPITLTTLEITDMAENGLTVYAFSRSIPG